MNMFFYVLSPNELRTFLLLQDATKCASSNRSQSVFIKHEDHLKSNETLSERVYNQNLEIASLKDEIDRLTAIK